MEDFVGMSGGMYVKILFLFQGWVFNVVPWVVTMFSSVFSGWLADHMLSKGQYHQHCTVQKFDCLK